MSGEVIELTRYAGAFCPRTADRAEHRPLRSTWCTDHPGEEPGPALRQVWDRRAWADARPDKVVPSSGAELSALWVE